MKRRNSYSDLGLVISISVFICILTKCVLFGPTWGGIVWLVITLVYFFLSFKYPSEGKVVRHSTTTYLILSVVVATSVVLFDRKATPELHAFAGTGDTIQDVHIVEEAPPVEEYIPYVLDTTVVDTAVVDTTAERPVETIESDEVGDGGNAVSADSADVN